MTETYACSDRIIPTDGSLWPNMKSCDFSVVLIIDQLDVIISNISYIPAQRSLLIERFLHITNSRNSQGRVYVDPPGT